ncbi:cytosolic endo-beta-N-acetylglucosaminidase [Elysia marginata]|uniref:Cytosolic endo-beta-N-acetylglucosaminidase n=1 Tax=Elysia marginata TaxID=1093978 RepID=A0AAV4IDS1_9GAST|nr:cytosolic endo-beta-N-acetylglucosaminidase [Elysia marginata]
MVLSEGLSCAFFAPGWVMEHLGPENFQENNIKFWGLLADLLNTRPTSLPFSTSFCQGKGDKYYLHGKIISDKPWYNIGLQQMQPSFTQSQFTSYSVNVKHIPIAFTAVMNKDENEEPKGSVVTDVADSEMKTNPFSEDKILSFGFNDDLSKNIDVNGDRENISADEKTASSAKPKEVVEIDVITEKKLADVNPTMTLDLCCGYNGGGCICLQAFATSSQPVIFKLVDISKIENLKQLSLTWKAKQSYPQFALMLSPATREASLENATVIFETNITTSAAADALFEKTPKSVSCIGLENPHESTNNGSWAKSVHTVRPGSFNFSETYITDMTLSAVLVPCDPLSTESGHSICVWLGQIQALTELPSLHQSQSILFSNLSCLQVKARPNLSHTDLVQMVMNPCFKANQTLGSTVSNIHHLKSGSNYEETTKEICTNHVTPAAYDKFQTALFLTKNQNGLGEFSSANFTKLDLTDVEMETNDSCIMHYLLKWDISNRDVVDYFVVYLGTDVGSSAMVGFASSGHFVYSTCNELKNMSFFIQPVLLF